MALAAAAAVAIKPSAAPDKSARLDVVSLAQSTLGFGGLLLAFSNASSFSFESPFIWAPLVLGALFLVLFVRRQKRVDDPLISMDIFSSRQYLSLIHIWPTTSPKPPTAAHKRRCPWCR